VGGCCRKLEWRRRSRLVLAREKKKEKNELIFLNMAEDLVLGKR